MCVDDFIQFLTSEKHYSPHTITAYQNDLYDFFDFVGSAYEITDIGLVDHQVVRSWLAHLMQSGASARTAGRKLSSLRSYFRFLVKRNVVKENPMLKVVAPRTAKKLPVFIEKEKMDKLFREVAFEPGFAGMRNRVVIEMLYATGMRVSELISLRHKDIDPQSMTLLVTGKRNKQRIIPFGPCLLEVIEDYNKAKKEYFGLIEPNGFFITSVKGIKAYPKLIYNIVTQTLNLVTTQTRKSPHVIRHTFATGMLNSGADLNAIKELLGHANLAATQVYTHNTIDRIKRIYQQAHPKA